MRFLFVYILWPLVKYATIVVGMAAILLVGIPMVIGLDWAMRLVTVLLALCCLGLVAVFLISAWDRYERDQKARP